MTYWNKWDLNENDGITDVFDKWLEILVNIDVDLLYEKLMVVKNKIKM